MNEIQANEKINFYEEFRWIIRRPFLSFLLLEDNISFNDYRKKFILNDCFIDYYCTTYFLKKNLIKKEYVGNNLKNKTIVLTEKGKKLKKGFEDVFILLNKNNAPELSFDRFKEVLKDV